MAALGQFRFPFRPRLWPSLKGYGRGDLAADLGAGITVTLVALPLTMAFAIASGVRPEQGIVTAIVGGLIVSVFGGSKVQIAGPAGAFVALSTFALTVTFDLSVAVEVGLVLSSLFFIYRISALTKVEPIALSPARSALPGGRRLGAYQLYGSIFFGSVTKLENLPDPAKPLPDVVVLDMHQVLNIDTTGLDALESLLATLHRRDGRLVLVDLNEQPMSLLERSGFLEQLGGENLFDDFDTALGAAGATAS